MLGARLEYYVGVMVNSLAARILDLVRVTDDLNFLISIYYFCCRIVQAPHTHTSLTLDYARVFLFVGEIYVDRAFSALLLLPKFFWVFAAKWLCLFMRCNIFFSMVSLTPCVLNHWSKFLAGVSLPLLAT